MKTGEKCILSRKDPNRSQRVSSLSNVFVSKFNTEIRTNNLGILSILIYKKSLKKKYTNIDIDIFFLKDVLSTIDIFE